MLIWTVIGLVVAAKVLNVISDRRAEARIRANAVRRETDAPEANR